MGRNVTLGCDPVPRRLYLFWYRQTPGKGMGFLISIYNKVSSEKADFLKDHFSAEMPDGSERAKLTVPGDVFEGYWSQKDTEMFPLTMGSATTSRMSPHFCALGQGPQFLFEFYENMQRAKGNFPGRFSAQQFRDARSQLNVSSLELSDSALLLCCVALCLLGAGPGNAGVTQDPKFRVLRTGQSATLKCAQDLDHYYMCWYRQDLGHGLRLIHYSSATGTTNKGDTLGQGPELLIYFQNKDAPEASGMPNDRFSAERPEGSYSHLKIQPAEPRDSAVYLCASSLIKQCHTVASFFFTSSFSLLA
eukprot:bmy_21191T0